MPGVANAWSPRNPAPRSERERDEDEPRITTSHGRLVGEVGKRHVDERHDQDQPEMARLMAPLEVQLWLGDEHGQSQHWQDERKPPRLRSGVGLRCHQSFILQPWAKPIREID